MFFLFCRAAIHICCNSFSVLPFLDFLIVSLGLGFFIFIYEKSGHVVAIFFFIFVHHNLLLPS